MTDLPQGIVLGEWLDQLLNRGEWRWQPSWAGQGRERHYGIILPRALNQPRGDPDSRYPSTGSGNIVICGKAGSGKSTLALQIAYACTQPPNCCAAAYISLEQSLEGLMVKAEGFEWADAMQEVRHLHPADEGTTRDDLADFLAAILSQPRDCPLGTWQEGGGAGQRGGAEKTDPRQTHEKHYKCARVGLRPDAEWGPRVLLLSLSPASPAASRQGEALFQERYRQLERFLIAAERLDERARRKAQDSKDEEKQPEEFLRLPLVCIDSLNVFGSGPPVREEYHRLFDLFHRHRMIGVFTVEAGGQTPFDSTMADVVINLTSDREQGYYVQYLEIEKSRYVPQAFGLHTFKILSPKRDQGGATPALGRLSLPGKGRHRDQ
ncbi:MAG: hypothetical protein FJ288_05825 [Planctomycetes bacterium]|nr:hypothetical protein [Planctomycetota bacterium]